MGTRYWFENWQNGHMVRLVTEFGTSVSEVVARLSDEYKGVFLLTYKQTEKQRYQENLKEYERRAGDI